MKKEFNTLIIEMLFVSLFSLVIIQVFMAIAIAPYKKMSRTMNELQQQQIEQQKQIDEILEGIDRNG